MVYGLIKNVSYSYKTPEISLRTKHPNQILPPILQKNPTQYTLLLFKMFAKYFALAAALATTLIAAPVAAPEAKPQEITGPFGTLAIEKDGSSSFVPWYAPLIPGKIAPNFMDHWV